MPGDTYLQAAWVDGAEAAVPAALVPRFRTLEEEKWAGQLDHTLRATQSERCLQQPVPALGPHLSFLGDPQPTFCCCCRSRSCHSCKVSGRRLSSPAGSSRLVEDRTGDPGQGKEGPGAVVWSWGLEYLLLGAFPTSPATRLNSEGSCS